MGGRPTNFLETCHQRVSTIVNVTSATRNPLPSLFTFILALYWRGLDYV